MNDEPLYPFPARLPKALHRQLKRKAERNVRSLNSELIVAVRYYLTLGALPDQAAPEPEPTSQEQE